MQVDSDLLGTRESGRQCGECQACSPGGENQAESPAAEREQNALGQQLSDDAASAGAQGGPYCEFTHASGGASQ